MGDRDRAPVERGGLEQPVQRLGVGGTGRPVGLVLAMAAILAVLVWQPWTAPTIPPHPSQVPIALASPGSPSAPAAPGPAASSVPASTVAPSRAPDGNAVYASLVDNEWTVVALLAPPAARSTEEPATQHSGTAPWPPADPYLVLQQGVVPAVRPIGGAQHPDRACASAAVPRDRTAVPLPAGRVAYLGVTFPGMDPGALVTAAIAGPVKSARTGFVRVASVVVALAGLAPGVRYLVPSTGIGGAVLFAFMPSRPMPSGTYRFDVTLPGIAGPRYLYACVGG